MTWLGRRLLAVVVAGMAAGCDGLEADRYLGERYPSGAPGAAVAVVREGRVIYSGSFGLANLEHRIPIGGNTVFDAASTAKQFTAFALLTLERDGLVRLDDPAERYVGDIYPALRNSGVTIRHLLSHTSGIRDYVWAVQTAGRRFDDVHTPDHVIRLLARQKELDSRNPGTRWVYNNTGYFLIAAIISRVTDRNFAAHMRQAVFEPIGMQDTRFIETPGQVIRNRADAYGSSSEGCSNTANEQERARCINATALPGPASLFTTVTDMARWLARVHEGLNSRDPRFVRLFEPSTLDGIAKPSVTDCQSPARRADYAGGYYLDEWNSQRIACHAGTWRGFRAFELLLLEKRVSVIVLSNRPDSLAFLRETAFGTLQIFEPAATPPAGARRDDGPATVAAAACAAAPSADYTGTYYSAELEATYSFSLDGEGRLVGRTIMREDVRLCHDRDDSFRGGNAHWLARVRFVRRNGAVATAEISAALAANRMVFQRIR